MEKETVTDTMETILFSDIPVQELDLSPEDEVSFRKLCRILEEKNLSFLRGKLEELGNTPVMTVLFSGLPYGDMTEVLLQLSRRSDMNLIQARTSSIRIDSDNGIRDSIKGFFSEFSSSKEKRTIASIVNDVVLSDSSKEMLRTVSTIGDCISRELSHFRGILFLLTESRDFMSAELQDRFLFKVNFTEPSPSIMEKKWEHLSDGLLAEYAPYLSRHFVLGTAQMKNVCTLVRIDYLLDGKLPPKETVIAYCSAETRKARTSIGFIK